MMASARLEKGTFLVLLLLLLLRYTVGRPCRNGGFWYSNTFEIGGCKVNPFELSDCTSTRSPSVAFYDCLFNKNKRAKPRSWWNWIGGDDEDDYDDEVEDFGYRRGGRGPTTRYVSGQSYKYYTVQRRSERMRVGRPRNPCQVDKRKMDYCIYRYQDNSYSAIMCYLLPGGWHF